MNVGMSPQAVTAAVLITLFDVALAVLIAVVVAVVW